VTDSSEGKSKLALAIESRVRKVYEFEVQGLFGIGNKEIHKIAFRVNTKAEEDESIQAAHSSVKAMDDDAKRDPDLLRDRKTAEALFRACRRCEEGDKEKNYGYPAFPLPSWMTKNMTTDQLSILLNYYNEVRAKEGPLDNIEDMDQVRAVAKGCAATSKSDIPETLLAEVSREWLTHAFVLISAEWAAMAKELTDGNEGRRAAGGSDQEAQDSGKQAEEASGEDAEGGGVGSGEGEADAQVQEPDGKPGSVDSGVSSA